MTVATCRRRAYRPTQLATALVATVGAVLTMTTMVVAPAAAGAPVGCRTVITESTTLTADVGPCRGKGIVIAADNITVDLGGHRIIGNPRARVSPDKAGILLRMVSGVTLKNGIVEGFDAGVVVMGGGHNTIRGITARANVNYRVVTGRDSQPEDIVPDRGPYCDLGDGIAVINSQRNVLRANTLVGNGPYSAIALVADSNRNVVSDNDIRDNDVTNETPEGEGTTCGSTANGPIPDPPPFCCDAHGRHSQDVGVRIEGPGAENNVVERNRIRRSGLAGVLITGYMLETPGNNGSNLVRANTITRTAERTHTNTGDGPESYRGSGIQIHHSGPDFIHTSHGNVIDGNNSSRNWGAGIEVTGPSPGSGVLGQFGNTIINNVADDNFLDGIHLAEGTAHTSVVRNQVHGNAPDRQAVAVINEEDPYTQWVGADGADYNPRCGTNTWWRNLFGTVNQRCVAAGGTGTLVGPLPSPAGDAQRVSSSLAGDTGDRSLHRGRTIGG